MGSAISLPLKKDVYQCSSCKVGKKYHCKLCNIKHCSNCSFVLYKLDQNREDTVLEAPKGIKIQGNSCSLHGKNNCELFCRDCKIPVCAKCVVGVHRLHDHVDFQVFIYEKRNQCLNEIKHIECLLLPKFQHQTKETDEKDYENTIESIFHREEEICTAVRNYGSKLREEITKYKQEYDKMAYQNLFAAEKIENAVEEVKSSLTSRDSKDILDYSGIERKLLVSPHELDNFVPIFETKNFAEVDIAHLFGELKKKDGEDKNAEWFHWGKFEKKAWFHGYIPKNEAERLLLKDGDFLVRESISNREHGRCFIISIYQQGPLHFNISPNYAIRKVDPKATVKDFKDFLRTEEIHLLPSSKSSIRLRGVAREKTHLDPKNIVYDSNDLMLHTNKNLQFQGKYGSESVLIQAVGNEEMFEILTLLRRFEHPNIIKLIGYSALQRPALLFMENLSGGILLSYLRKNDSSISKRKRVEMCHDVASGMAYLHINGCIHRDLAARNCSVGDNTTVKISNFLMTELEEVPKKIDKAPIKWTAPEVLIDSDNYTCFSDTWSFGILMWEIFSSGNTPYPRLTNIDAREKVKSGYKMSAPDGTPMKCSKLMLQCWEFNPTDRYAFDKIEENLKEIINDIELEEKQHTDKAIQS